jgi:hypothetical protein
MLSSTVFRLLAFSINIFCSVRTTCLPCIIFLNWFAIIIFFEEQVKGKVVPVQIMVVYRGNRGVVPSSLTSKLDGGEWSCSRVGSH